MYVHYMYTCIPGLFMTFREIWRTRFIPNVTPTENLGWSGCRGFYTQVRYLTNGELVWLVVLESTGFTTLLMEEIPRKCRSCMGGWSHTTSPPQNPLSEGFSAEFQSFPFTAQSVFCLLPDFSIFSAAPPFLFLVLSLLPSLARANPRQIAVLWSDLTNHQAILIYFLYSYHTL